ncbi:related to kinesin-like protein [Cephalotrichum gorgonifer]|uniref:Related to kinesin-like protein n=1 Tax=Cephalotrichum gorgonifer TaxID=2041049 RepID=A0AAE8MZN2_9PEZI|nr:related to kinesin-like protein [Cephalotrichum gorgonifer]
MASSPPASPGQLPQRPMSAMVRPAPRSSSRLSQGSKAGGGSRASDDETRTAVKVAVRVRPPLKPSDPGFDLIPQRFKGSMVHLVSDTSLTIDSPQGKKLFVFDRVFGEETGQDGVWDYVSDCVNSFVQGYNVSLLAYGQSGAGKSYTMGTSGPQEQGDGQSMGVIPRAAMALFESLDTSKAATKKSNRHSMSQLRSPQKYSSHQQTTSERGWTLTATYVEIYNELLRDLLISDQVAPNERSPVTIREDVKGNIILTGLRHVEINSMEDLMKALNFGSTIRQTDATAINAKSSRSHAVFSLNLVQRKSGTPTAEKRFSVPLESMTGSEVLVTTDSKLHFVDLAGSERLKNTGAQGERAKEGISINAGLASLGKVISQLSSRQAGSHVSYRDSKLTRLLQDSLGGNAITYMIACVTPAEFHISETLNTVQYAQRARAIQSKPRIQQVEEGDKQAIIDRLKAEISFLREQIRSSDRVGGERRNPATSERSERPSERELELQNQLLDTQETYSTLSQRHARLIAEMAKARDNEAAAQELDESGEIATERLNRSNSFAQAVEQVVLEYEKTIQSLEQSLSSTRASLSNTEASLLEKESKFAYSETINSQLQARLQKLMDREANTENYLHDLESKLDGHTSGEEKNATIIIELRKEIARVKENEASCEDYISTLEERLAEADQDAELMQREIDRLEQVIERQRSLGKLDSLLYELDNLHQDVPAETPEINGVSRRRSSIPHSRTQSHVSHMSRHSQKEAVIPEGEEGEEDQESEEHLNGDRVATPVGAKSDEEPTDATERELSEVEEGELEPAAEISERRQSPGQISEQRQSPAQTRYVADKLESVTQELVTLRVEHENTVNEYDNLHAKYEEALRSIADLQDIVDETRHPHRTVRDSILSVTSPTTTRPDSFMSDTRSSDRKDGRYSSSRSLSSELSSALESPATADTSDAETATAMPGSRDSPLEYDDIPAELERLKTLAAEKEAAERQLTDKYVELQAKHGETLDLVEELKTEVSKARAAEASSPRGNTPVIRRKSSQNIMIIDRAHRSFASLRNIATENFEGQPDVMQNFELNVNSAMHELHVRSERIQELEADIAAARKEMETKMTIISGLTRERTSMQASPRDMSVMSALRNQLEQSELQFNSMRDAHALREKELMDEVENLRASLERAESGTATVDPETARAQEGKIEQPQADTTAVEEKLESELESSRAIPRDTTEEAAQTEKIIQLQSDLAEWEEKHEAALSKLKSTEVSMQRTVDDLESQLAEANAKLAESQAKAVDHEAASEMEARHQEMVGHLQGELDEYKAIISSNAAKVAELEAAHAAARAELDEAIKQRDEAAVARDTAQAEAATQKELAATLETVIDEYEDAARAHQKAMQALNISHAKELDALKATEQSEYEAQVDVLMSEHSESVKILEAELDDARQELTKVTTQVAFALGVSTSVERITERIAELMDGQKSLAEEQKKRGELELDVVELSSINDTVMRDLEAVRTVLDEMVGPSEERANGSTNGLASGLETLKKRMEELDATNKKHSRLVEELEEQLQQNFDQAQLTTNRLSVLQSERNQQLEEANEARSRAQAELDAARDEYAALQSKYEELGNPDAKRTNSMSSQIRKSTSVVSLPSPPPAIPLPPLPASGFPAAPSSPTTSGRPMSKDNMAAISQIRDDQEARIRTIEKHLDAEKQLTATLEEALSDLEKQSKKVKSDCDAWRRRAGDLEGELRGVQAELKEEREKASAAGSGAADNRWSLQAVEEERRKRQAAEAARAQLELRMEKLNGGKGKKAKKGSLNCF